MKFAEYLLKKIIPFFFVALILIAFILNLIDLFMNISKYMEVNASITDILKVMLYYTPKTIWYAAPIAFLFTVTFVLSTLYSNNEMEAIFASGVSLFKFVIPLLLFSILLSFGIFFLEDKLVVSNLEKKTLLQNKILGVETDSNNNDIVVLSDNSKIVYKVKRYREKEKKLEQLYIVFRNDEKQLEGIIYAKSAIWNSEENKWNLDNVILYVPDDNDSMVISPVTSVFLDRLTESYEIFRKKTVDVETVSVKEAKEYIDHLKKAGLPFFEQQSIYYKKFAFPFILFISGFLAVGLTGKTRKNILLISMSLSILAVVLYYVFQMMTMVFAKTEILTPFLGAWLPDIVFTFIAVILLKFSRT